MTTIFKRLQAAIACSEAPYTAPESKQVHGICYKTSGVLPPELHGLWCLTKEMDGDIEKIRDSIRRRKLGCEPDEEVRDDHDYVEQVVAHELETDPLNRTLTSWKGHVDKLMILALKEIFPDEQEFAMYLRFNWIHVDESWLIKIPV